MSFRRNWRPKQRTVTVEGTRVLTVKSGLEANVALQIDATVGKVRYEEDVIKYDIPARTAKYTPDFKLPNGIIIESKGIFDAEDRKKHEIVHAQHPHLDIRFIFSDPNKSIYKGSPTTHAAWCEARGFKYAKKLIPDAWFKETHK